MESAPMSPTEAAILERLLEPGEATLSLDAARYVLALTFPPRDRERIDTLESKAQAGVLTPADQAELENYRHICQVLARVQQKARAALEAPEPAIEVPPGILRSQQAFWRDLPELLKKKRNHDKWVCYHGDDRIGIAWDTHDLIREIHRRALPNDAYYLAIIQPQDAPPWEDIEVESPRPPVVEEILPEP
jgi:hypothetical protein